MHTHRRCIHSALSSYFTTNTWDIWPVVWLNVRALRHPSCMCAHWIQSPLLRKIVRNGVWWECRADGSDQAQGMARQVSVLVAQQNMLIPPFLTHTAASFIKTGWLLGSGQFGNFKVIYFCFKCNLGTNDMLEGICFHLPLVAERITVAFQTAYITTSEQTQFTMLK